MKLIIIKKRNNKKNSILTIKNRKIFMIFRKRMHQRFYRTYNFKL
jgi:hypothetical protein